MNAIVMRSKLGKSAFRVTESDAVSTRTEYQAPAQEVVGFGCPAMDWPHHLRVVIPPGRSGEIQFIEDFGMPGRDASGADDVLRCTLSRARWSLIAVPVKHSFNPRLQAMGLPPGRWCPGENKVERMLGQELLALVWPCAEAEQADLAAILANWQALRPEERWWLAGRVAANPTVRVRRGLALLMAGGRVAGAPEPPRVGNDRPRSFGLPPFDFAPRR